MYVNAVVANIIIFVYPVELLQTYCPASLGFNLEVEGGKRKERKTKREKERSNEKKRKKKVGRQ